MVAARKFQNTTEAYMTGYHEGSEATHQRYIEAIGAMEPKRERPPEIEPPDSYIVTYLGGVLSMLHVEPGAKDWRGGTQMAQDSWKATLCSETEVRAMESLISEYYKRKASGDLVFEK